MLPKFNTNLFVRVLAPEGEDSLGDEYRTRVADVDAETISIEEPIHVQSGHMKNFVIGDHLHVQFQNESGVKHYFTTDVIGFRQEGVRLVVLRAPDPDSVAQVQRRKYLRVPAQLEIAVRLSDQYRFLAMTDDIGGGGVSFHCGGLVPIQPRDVISCWLLISHRSGSIEHIPFKGEVVRLKEQKEGRQLVMAVFSDIAEADRGKVIRFCFEKQLEFRKR